MPIEIRELVIKASVDETGVKKGKNAGTSEKVSDRDEIVADCVEQVIELLRSQLER
jgi:hypothetical protein